MTPILILKKKKTSILMGKWRLSCKKKLVLSLLKKKVFILLITNTNFDVYSKEDQERET